MGGVVSPRQQPQAAMEQMSWETDCWGGSGEGAALQEQRGGHREMSETFFVECLVGMCWGSWETSPVRLLD